MPAASSPAPRAARRTSVGSFLGSGAERGATDLGSTAASLAGFVVGIAAATAGRDYMTASGSHCCSGVVLPFADAVVADTIEVDKNDSRFARERIAGSDEECNSASQVAVHQVME